MQDGRFDLPAKQWAALRELLDTGLALPPAQRAAWLDGLGAEHVTLAPRLRALLAHADDPRLDTLPRIETGDFAAPISQSPDPCITHVGPYRLLRQIGEGGMASVWLAERTDLLQRRQVALKLPHGAWRRAGLAERFAREREILATLAHPHIARLYDAGIAEDGQPWLAIEYVEGQRIDHYGTRQALTLPARLALLLQVMEAVAHAHARLVVHRDLKPGNILVTADGQVRLLDFGIAKLLDQDAAEETALTRDGGRVMTPDYAAPEQIRGEPSTTAVDVYALGVVLYELLTGQRPFAAQRLSRAALEQAILGADPPAPSSVATDRALRTALRGDLDTIVQKALEKDPAQRYASVEAFAADLRRHLAHEPLLARPEPAWSRLRKFLRRHRWAVGAGAALTLSLVGGTAAALWQAAQARAGRDAALRAQALAEAQTDLSDFLISELSVGQSSAAAVAVLDRAAVLARAQFPAGSAMRAELLLDVVMRLRPLGDMDRTAALLDEAEPALRAAAAADGLARLLCVRATEAARTGALEPARALLAEARLARQRITTPDSYVHTGCLLEEALVERAAGRPLQALQAAEAAVQAERHSGRGDRLFTGEVLLVLARSQNAAGRYRDAATTTGEATALLDRLGQRSSPTFRSAVTHRAMALHAGGQVLAALAAHGAEGRLDPAGPDTAPYARVRYAETLAALGRHDEALAQLARADADATALGNRSERTEIAVRRARVLTDAGRRAQADAELTRLESALPAGAAPWKSRAVLLERLHWALAAGDAARAAALLQSVQSLLAGHAGEDARAERAAHRGAAQLALLQGDRAAALQAASQALAISGRDAIEPDHGLWVAEDLLLQARAQPDAAAARRDAAQAARLAEADGGADHPVAQQARVLAQR
jgi:eukaryotic-like serine/threonine-protein kinase